MVDGSEQSLYDLSTAESDRIVRDYWTLVRDMAETGLFDIAGHIDMIDKGSPGFQPSFDVSPLISEALESIHRAGMTVEVNASGLYSPCAHAFPKDEILKQCLRLGIPVVATADAHKPAHVDRGLSRASAILEQVGYLSTASLPGISQRRTI